ncbi:uncharacterized protein LOC134282356 isoform X3 [Saccostrea cucullata]|uniref:uncharacterized protein LOC134282356 isoform X3 n=1 Tax=Saccostrea cuccullata TaxID=36930 RepID=UPI002ED4499B
MVCTAVNVKQKANSTIYTVQGEVSLTLDAINTTPTMAFSTICLKHLILIMCVPHIHSAILDSEFCEASQSTQTEVVKCPTDELTWSRAAEMKNCSHYNHKCKGQLSYHCVINPWQNATVEVCAPETQINAGHCAEYNLRGGKIQEFYKKTCEDCTNEYISTEAYKYFLIQIVYLNQHMKKLKQSKLLPT